VVSLLFGLCERVREEASLSVEAAACAAFSPRHEGIARGHGFSLVTLLSFLVVRVLVPLLPLGPSNKVVCTMCGCER